jgi:hypothetical protein
MHHIIYTCRDGRNLIEVQDLHQDFRYQFMICAPYKFNTAEYNLSIQDLKKIFKGEKYVKS